MQSYASGSFLQTCINFVEQRLKFSHFGGSNQNSFKQCNRLLDLDFQPGCIWMSMFLPSSFYKNVSLALDKPNNASNNINIANNRD